MRQGYRLLQEALSWLGKNKKVNVTRQIGGVMEPGIHKATLVEYQSGGSYVDLIFESEDRLYHKERTWGSYGKPAWKPPLGSRWQFELWYGGDGKHHIERGGDKYYLIDETFRRVVFESESIRAVYSFVRDNNIKLKYLKMKWKKSLD